jgi:hypothetical protein
LFIYLFTLFYFILFFSQSEHSPLSIKNARLNNNTFPQPPPISGKAITYGYDLRVIRFFEQLIAHAFAFLRYLQLIAHAFAFLRYLQNFQYESILMTDFHSVA